MARLWLVRHGRAAATWTDHADPGLHPEGVTQAEDVARRLKPLPPKPILSSPLARARETAAPLARLWQANVAIADPIAEIPSPGVPFAARGAWLQGVMTGHWSTLDPALQAWRHTALDFLARQTGDAICFTHFILINVAFGAAARDDRVMAFRPDYCSVTVIDVKDGAFTLIEKGAEAETIVR